MKKIIIISGLLSSLLVASNIKINTFEYLNKNECNVYSVDKKINITKKTKQKDIYEIDCSNKKIKTIPISVINLKNLYKINMSDNNIKELNVELKNKELLLLNLKNNPIKITNKSNYKKIGNLVLNQEEEDKYNDSIIKNFTSEDFKVYNKLVKKYKGITWYELDYYYDNTNRKDEVKILALNTIKVKKLLKVAKINLLRQRFLFNKYQRVCNYKIKRYHSRASIRLDIDEQKAFGKILSNRSKLDIKKYNYYLQKFRDKSSLSLNNGLRQAKCMQDKTLLKVYRTLLK
jgi:hypothetical protein